MNRYKNIIRFPSRQELKITDRFYVEKADVISMTEGKQRVEYKNWWRNELDKNLPMVIDETSELYEMYFQWIARIGGLK